MQNFVDQIFSSVSSKYDIMNDLMSAGMHRLWKRSFVKSINVLAKSKIIDMASGTGDIALSILKRSQSVDITLCDKNQDMLQIAKERLINKNFLSAEVVNADSAKLPFESNQFDYYTVAFGVRNFQEIEQSLKEAFRVLKPGGQFCCLEFSNVENQCISKLYDLYSYNVIPFIGQKIAKNRSAYQYLVESIRQFPTAEKFAEMIKDSGFKNVKYTKHTFGVVAMHYGLKTCNSL